MNNIIRWGILGTGFIARQLAIGLKSAPGAELVAVGSRTQAQADLFGDTFGVPRRHPTYESLANDPDVEVIYVSTPHPLHCPNTLLCLNAGKAVLCEKPFAINAAEAAQMVNLARQKGLFLMEAMWTRWLPAVVKVRQLIAEGVLGEIRMLMADLGFKAEFNPQGRLFNPQLGGGALLDVGVYPISFASMLFGPPVTVTGAAHLGQTGVDEQSAYLFSYAGGQLSILASAVSVETPSQALIMGTKGRVRVHGPIYRPTQLTLTLSGQADQLIDAPLEGNGYNYQAVEVMNCLRAGKLESDLMPLDETLSIMRTMDELRRPWGLRYPTE